MNSLPKLFRALFTALYGLLTFSFVALVAYAATAGAFGGGSDESNVIGTSDCESQTVKLHNDLVTEGVRSLAPYRDDRLARWNTTSQRLGLTLEGLRRKCTQLEVKQQIQALGQLLQAYTTAIRSFETRGRNAVLRLEPKFSGNEKQQDKDHAN